jgi:hypothetical protein
LLDWGLSHSRPRSNATRVPEDGIY